MNHAHPDVAESPSVVVIISAHTEWKAARSVFAEYPVENCPFGEWFVMPPKAGGKPGDCIILHGGWGKIAAAASAQYVVDRWHPRLLVNLGTCGGIRGFVERGDVILAERTVVYDIIDRMGDGGSDLERYTTRLDLSWLPDPLPHRVFRGLLVSGDRDLDPADIQRLRKQYEAVAADWESGAIAWVAYRNGIRCLILRGVSDLVDPAGGEAYDGNEDLYRRNAETMIRRLISWLPDWIRQSTDANQNPAMPDPFRDSGEGVG